MHPFTTAFLLNTSPIGSIGESMPLVATVAPFVFVIFIVAIKAIQKIQQQKLRHDTIRMAIDKGQPLPPELLNEAREARPRTEDRKAGMILIAVAVGLFLFFNSFQRTQPDTRGIVWLALIPGLIGVALLVNWALTRREETKDEKKPF